MFLGNDTVTVQSGGEDVAVDGCLVQILIESGTAGAVGRALIRHPLRDGDTIRTDGHTYTARDVTGWWDAAGAFDHSEVVLEEVGDGGHPD